jgi:mRNA interferase RelE/StbE
MRYKIVYDEKVLSDVKKIQKDLLNPIRKAIESRLSERPYDFRPLSGKKYHGIWRLRVGDYRIAYKITEEEKLITILCIDIRGKIYDVLENRV